MHFISPRKSHSVVYSFRKSSSFTGILTHADIWYFKEFHSWTSWKDISVNCFWSKNKIESRLSHKTLKKSDLVVKCFRCDVTIFRHAEKWPKTWKSLQYKVFQKQLLWKNFRDYQNYFFYQKRWSLKFCLPERK